MQFHNLYNRIIKLWPEEIDISDGYPTSEKGFMFPTLSSYWGVAEEEIDHSIDHWGNVGVWSFFQAFHNAARELYDNGEKCLKTKDVSKNEIDKRIRSNIEPEEWQELLDKYVGLG